MDIQSVDQTTRKLAPQPAPRTPRFSNLRAWLRSRTGRIVTLSVVLLVGIFVGDCCDVTFRAFYRWQPDLPFLRPLPRVGISLFKAGLSIQLIW